MQPDRLVPIPIESLPALQQLYRRDWPQHEIVYNCLQNYIEWLRIDRKLKDFSVFSLNDTWRENGTFIIQDRYELFFHTLAHINDTLTRALSLVDWDYSWKMTVYYPRHRSSVLETIKKHNLQIQYEFCTEIMYLSKENALRFDVTIPHNLQLRTLTSEDAVKANLLWPFRAVGSEFLLKRLASWNPSVGLFDKTTDEMVAWCFRLQCGAHGALEVPVEHRRKGYGTIVAKALAKKLAEMGFNSYAFIHTQNNPSREMFQKLGFEAIGILHWTRNEARKLVEWDR
ncbi:uncharacterized protein LOC126565180 [Anopheles maculipalpis]|uniref:uncharacterized protein LOC126565180 n=1 Tax=Anopheles maculipalpis TaxID=1496333 RepID=UPI002158DE52|nr:uncharacterized protein LOC126565180 [Anopheles maculipalpis]